MTPPVEEKRLADYGIDKALAARATVDRIAASRRPPAAPAAFAAAPFPVPWAFPAPLAAFAATSRSIVDGLTPSAVAIARLEGAEDRREAGEVDARKPEWQTDRDRQRARQG